MTQVLDADLIPVFSVIFTSSCELPWVVVGRKEWGSGVKNSSDISGDELREQCNFLECPCERHHRLRCFLHSLLKNILVSNVKQYCIKLKLHLLWSLWVSTYLLLLTLPWWFIEPNKKKGMRGEIVSQITAERSAVLVVQCATQRHQAKLFHR